MIRVLKLFLPICILLLSGYIKPDGHSYEESVCFSSIKNTEGSCFSGYVAAQNCPGVMISSVSDTERDNRLNHQAKLEEKEDELASFKKFIEFSSDFAITFYTQTPGQFSPFIKPCLFFYKHVFCFPSYKSLFLKLKVFRI